MSDEIATRQAYGEALAELASQNKNVVALDADLSKSTKSAILKSKFPERFFDMGVAEADMIGTAAGLAIGGKLPFASSFAVFATSRCLDQVRVSVAYSNLNVKIVGSHAGLATGEDGATHQATEDIAVMRAMPNITVIVPADAIETRKSVFAIAEHPGPVYLRTCRLGTPALFDESYDFEIGKGSVVKDGSDVSIAACGIMVSKAVEAAALLEKDGVSARVLNLASIKPLDNALVLKAAKETGAIVSCEDHSIIGGLGGAIAELLSVKRPTKMAMVGLPDKFGESGKPEQLYTKYSMDPESIALKAKKILEKEE